MRARAVVGLAILGLLSACAGAPEPRPVDPRVERAEADNARVEKLVEDMDFAAAGPEADRVIAWIEAELGPDHPALAEALSNKGALLYYGQDIAGAKALFERALAIQAAALPEGHPDRADSLANLGAVAMAEQDHAKARRLYEQALAIRTQALGPEHEDVGDALHELAYPLLLDGEHERALELYRRALAIWEKALGPNDRRVGQGHLSLAMALTKLGRTDEANAHYEQALAIFDQALPALHPQRLQVLQAVATARWQAGKYSEARSLFEKILTAQEQQLGPDDPRLADILDQMGGVRSFTGDYAGALELHRRALALREKAHGPDHPAVAGSLYLLANQQLALMDLEAAGRSYRRARQIYAAASGADALEVAYCDFGLARIAEARAQFSAAQAVYERVLKTFQAALGPEHLEVANVLSALGHVYTQLGRLTRARELLEQALAIQEKIGGPDNPSVARTLTSLGQVASWAGDYESSVELLTRALDMTTESMGPEHPDVADLYGFLAEVMIKRGEILPAVQLYQKAIPIYEAVLGKQHLKVITALHNQAHALALAGEYALAAQHYGYALERYRAAYGPGHPWVAQARCTRALIDTFADKAAEALPECRQGLADLEAALGPDHPWLAANLRCLMLASWRTGDLDTAKSASQRALAIANRNIDTLIADADDAARARVVESRSAYYYNFMALHTKPGEDSRAAYDATLHWKGRVMQAQFLQQATVRDAADPAIHALVEKLRSIRRSLSEMIFAGLPTDPKAQAVWLQQNKDLSKQRSVLERKLARLSRSRRERAEVLSADTSSVCRRLRKDEALVDFVMLEDYMPPSRGEQSEGTYAWRYQAFVILPEACTAPVRVDLASLEEVHRPVLHLQELLGAKAAGGRVDRQLRRLWRLLWAPLQKQLEGRRRIWIVPDGVLNLVPFEVLRDPDGRFLIEQVTFNYLASAQQLVNRGKARRRPNRGLLAVGGVDYGQAKTPPAAAGTGRERFAPGFLPVAALPGAALEVARLHSLASKNGLEPAVFLEGKDATEQRLLQELAGKRIVHLATHGFFASDQTTEVNSWFQFATDTFSMRLYYTKTYNEMAMNGLVLAGANEQGPSPEGYDGILSALEVSGLDLSGMELLTLSACDSGLGNVYAGEGVMGLRRAFAIAGVRALVVSLWRVPDEQTRSLMEAFYRRVLGRKRTDKASALRAAKLEMIEKLRAAYGRADPHQWAAFILSGF